MSLKILNDMNGAVCSCGKIHRFSARVITGDGVLKQLPSVVTEYGAKKVFVLSDRNTYKAAGEQVCALLEAAGIAWKGYSFFEETVEPDERSVGSAVMHMDADSDLIVGVGSGVINDIGKILSALSGKPYIIVATAPSMEA